MTSSIDWLGLTFIVAAWAGVGVAVRKISGGRMNVTLRRVYVGILFLVLGALLWNTLAGLR